MAYRVINGRLQRTPRKGHRRRPRQTGPSEQPIRHAHKAQAYAVTAAKSKAQGYRGNQAPRSARRDTFLDHPRHAAQEKT